MITKFEKRIIAFLLAALMCSPVTAFSAVTVNAEETQETVQQKYRQMCRKMKLQYRIVWWQMRLQRILRQMYSRIRLPKDSR